jgi:hypothetical protein
MMDPAEAVRDFLDALEVPVEQIPTTVDGQVSRYRTTLAGKRCWSYSTTPATPTRCGRCYPALPNALSL